MDELADLERRLAAGEAATAVLPRALDVLRRHLLCPVTGLLDRRAFLGALEAAIQPAGAGDSGFALVRVQVEGLERLRRESGYARADRALAELARRVRPWAAAGGRLGADDLGFLFPSPEEGALKEMERSLSLWTDEAGRALSLAARVRTARFPRDGGDPKTLLSGVEAIGPLDGLQGPGEWRTHANLLALANLVRESASSAPADELARRVLAAIVQATGTERAILLVAAGGGELQPRFAIDGEGQASAEPGPYSRSLPLSVYRTGRPEARVLSADLTPAEMATSAGTLGLRAVMAAPLVAAGKRLGVVYVDSKGSVRRFEEADLALFEALAAQAALALERARDEEERRAHLERENKSLAEALSGGDAVVGQSPALTKLLDALRRVAPGEVTVTLQGESGTGKGHLARLLHALSGRRDRPFVEIDCAAIPEGLFESELFGHVEGAYTGAGAASDGLLAVAHGGTVLLDRVSELPLPLQGKLLRFLETREVRPVGATEARRIDVRVVAATTGDLGELAAKGAFREDLFFRLHVVRLHVPPLRDRGGDVLALARHFLDRFAAETGRPPIRLSEAAQRALLAHAWPGNIRELKNRLHRAVALGTADELEPDILELGTESAEHPLREARRRAIDEFEEGYVRRALEAHGWNVAATARALGLARQNLHKLITKYGVARP
ncbi:MAG: sigma 54-interacting transcriptional regulator [Planctomycetes bacterium]|nr:sigma 54-interacting transcriptional regulator [Planctomycetota bacterium]